MTSYEIIEYEDKHQADFAALNYAWIEKYFKVEEEDKKALEAPHKKIIAPGGAILLVALGEEIVGTCALIKMTNEKYELAKMAMDEKHQGQGLGMKLGLASIEKAKEMGAKTLYLETNSSLKPAIHLYHKLGFQNIENIDSPYERCNVQMELQL